MSGRDSVLRGSVIELTAVFFDALNNPADPTDISLSVYPPSKNPELGATTSDAWVYNVTLSDGGLGPEANPFKMVEKVSTGSYKYSFTVPEDADLGSGFDRWEATLDLEELDEVFNFVIVGGGSVGTTKLYENNIVYIKLAKEIQATDGTILGEDTYYYFTTTYNPLYASVRQVRLSLGSLISDVPDDTINLAIYEAGRDVDANAFQSVISNVNYYNYIVGEYTLLSAELVLIRALMGDALVSSRMSKTLGDLTVSRGGNLAGLRRREEEIQAQLKELRKGIRTGGLIATGASLLPAVAVKGCNAEDRITVARQWQPTSGIGINNNFSAANTSIYASGRKRKRTFRSR